MKKNRVCAFWKQSDQLALKKTSSPQKEKIGLSAQHFSSEHRIFSAYKKFCGASRADRDETLEYGKDNFRKS